MADDVQVQFGADIAGLTASMAQVREVLQGLSSPLRAVRDNLGEVAEAFVAAFAVEKITEFVKSMAELGEQTLRTSAMLGITTQEVAKFNTFAALSGTDAGGMAMAMERLQVALQHAQNPTSQQALALQAIGLSARDLIGLPLIQQFEKISEAQAQFADGGNKTAIIMALLGRAGAQMIPALNEGAHGFEEAGAAAERAGVILTKTQAEGFKATGDAAKELGMSLQGLGITVFSALKPAFDGIISALTTVVQGFNNAIRDGGTFKALLDTVAVAGNLLATSLIVAVAAVQTLWEVTKTVVQAIANDFTVLGRIIYAAMTGDMPGVKAAWADLMTANQGVAANAATAMEGIVGKMVGSLRKVWGAAKEEADSAAKGQAPALNIVDKDGVKSAMKVIDGEIAVLKQGFEQKKLLIDADYNQHAITEDRKFALLQAETEKEYQAELALLQKKMAIGGLDRTQKQDVLNQVSLLEAKHRTDMLKLDQQSIAARQKTYTDFANTIKSAWDSQLRGLLTGTVTWQQAFKNILLDLTMEFIKYAEKTVVEWVAAQVAKTTASQTGAAAQAATEIAGAEATLPARVAKFTSDITADAAAVFAGIFANLAPLMGPAASGPATAGSATVLASMAAVPKFEAGAYRIPRVMGAILHPGERVLNADEAAKSRGEKAGGGGDTYHVSFLDGHHAQDFIDRNIAAIAPAVSNYQKRNPSARPNW